MQKGLVSIISPCYNTGKYIHRLLDSVLMQDYPMIEMLVIDDGSSDNSREVIESYIQKFSLKGYRLEYQYQENQGQSVAINNALKWVKGEYLCWPDSDDYYSSSRAISQFVDAIKFSNCHIVRCLPTWIEENSLETIKTDIIDSEFSRSDQFDNCLNSTHMIWPPINYMIDMRAFDCVNPQREIYTEKMAGQNWQMLLPLFYSYKCHTMDASLCNVLVRKSSHSRGQFSGLKQTLEKEACYERTIIETIERISLLNRSEKDYYINRVKCKYAFNNMNLCIFYKKSEQALAFAKTYNGLSSQQLSKYTILICKYCNQPLLVKFFSLLRKLF